jgi:hypothetical protein
MALLAFPVLVDAPMAIEELPVPVAAALPIEMPFVPLAVALGPIFVLVAPVPGLNSGPLIVVPPPLAFPMVTVDAATLPIVTAPEE